MYAFLLVASRQKREYASHSDKRFQMEKYVMSERIFQKLSSKTTPAQSQPPLFRLQEYLIAGKTTCVLLKELLVELKEVIVTFALIGFFILGVWRAFHHLL
jgi:hypothetical protein